LGFHKPDAMLVKKLLFEYRSSMIIRDRKVLV